jgi:hypothetical protein
MDDWTGTVDRIRDPEQTRLVWYAEVGDQRTTIWANFQGANPNEELVEINVRRSVFYPGEHHLNYITVRGFELAQAASPWAPPTADQPGLIGPNWAKGWIIEDNVIHDAKCSAVSIDKEISTGHNYDLTSRATSTSSSPSSPPGRSAGTGNTSDPTSFATTASTTVHWELGWTGRPKALACRGTSSMTTSATSSWR